MTSGAAAVAVHARREIGESLVPERVGRAQAPAWLRTPLALAGRLQAPTLLAWAVGGAVIGGVLGSLTSGVADASLDNPNMVELLESMGGGSRAEMADTFVAAIMVMVGVLAATAGIQAVLRLRSEESEGRAEPLLAAPVSRRAWLLSAICAGTVSVAVVLVVTAIAAWLGFAADGDAEAGGRAAGQALLYLPAALVFVGAAAVFVTVVPRPSLAVSWGALLLAVLVSMFGGLLDLPAAVIDASPLSRVATVPVRSWASTFVLAVIAAALVAVSALAVRRRELTA